MLGLKEVLNQKETFIYFNAYGMQIQESRKHDNLISILEAMAAVELGAHDRLPRKPGMMSGGLIGIFVAVFIAVCVFIWLQKRKQM